MRRYFDRAFVCICLLLLCLSMVYAAVAEEELYQVKKGYFLQYETYYDYARITGFKSEKSASFKGKLVIPEMIDGLPVTDVGGVRNQEGITEVVLPSTVTRLSNSAFYGCDSLKKINLPEGLESIGTDAFRKTGLKKLILPESLKRIDTAAFADSPLEKITLPEGVESVARDVFKGCNKLKEITVKGFHTKFANDVLVGGFHEMDLICWPGSDADLTWTHKEFSAVTVKYLKAEKKTETASVQPVLEKQSYQNRRDITHLIIPEGVEEIGDEAFKGMSNLESIELPGSLKKLGERVFADCRSLKSVEFPGSLIEIGKDTFQNCAQLKTIKVGEGITALPENFASDCKSLTQVTLPSTLESIGDRAFDDCRRLEKISLPRNLKSLGAYCFSWCTRLKSIEIPTGVTVISDGAFDGCSSLSKIKFHGQVTHIGEYSFQMTGFKSITLPKGLKSIGTSAFLSCYKMKTITIPSSVESISPWGVLHPFDKKNGITVNCVKGSPADLYFQEHNDNIKKIKYIKEK